MIEPAGSRPIRVYVVDDHEVVRRGLRELLEDAGIEVVGASGSAGEATRRITALRPDVAILDGRLPMGAASTCAGTYAPATPPSRALS